MTEGIAARAHSRTVSARALFLCAAAAVPAVPAVPAVAQCPNGTPPPCARASRPAAASSHSVAVLYFENVTRDTADAYLADGLTEEVILRLSQVGRLTVKSRSAVRRFRDDGDADPTVIGRALAVTYLVTGSLSRAADRVRVRVELVRAADGASLWGDAYDRQAGNVFAIETEIAQAVATAITGRLLPEERTVLRTRPTRHPVAYDLYLRGRLAADHLTEPDLRQALALFEQALALDPQFALAHAGVADTWMRLADDWVAPGLAYPRAQQAIERALAIDSLLSQAHTTLGNLHFWYDRAYAAAESSFRRAITLDARDPAPHVALSFVYAYTRRDSAALAAALRARELDPFALSNQDRLTEILVEQRAPERAIAQARQSLLQFPAYYRAYVFLGEAYLALSQDSAALAAIRRAHDLAHGSRIDMHMAVALARTGRRAEARSVLDSLIAASDSAYVAPDFIAAVFAALGDADQAFTWLGRALEVRSATMLDLTVSPRWDSLRRDPRFAVLLARLRLT